MIERMARAMCIEFGFDWEHEVAMKGHEREGKSSESVPDYRDFIDMARVALAAMRVPTEAMAQCSVNAGWSGVIEGDPKLERERGVYLWQDMIDAALKSE